MPAILSPFLRRSKHDDHAFIFDTRRSVRLAQTWFPSACPERSEGSAGSGLATRTVRHNPTAQNRCRGYLIRQSGTILRHTIGAVATSYEPRTPSRAALIRDTSSLSPATTVVKRNLNLLAKPERKEGQLHRALAGSYSTTKIRISLVIVIASTLVYTV